MRDPVVAELVEGSSESCSSQLVQCTAEALGRANRSVVLASKLERGHAVSLVHDLEPASVWSRHAAAPARLTVASRSCSRLSGSPTWLPWA